MKVELRLTQGEVAVLKQLAKQSDYSVTTYITRTARGLIAPIIAAQVAPTSKPSVEVTLPTNSTASPSELPPRDASGRRRRDFTTAEWSTLTPQEREAYPSYRPKA